MDDFLKLAFILVNEINDDESLKLKRGHSVKLILIIDIFCI
jgi:hypothetical protein